MKNSLRMVPMILMVLLTALPASTVVAENARITNSQYLVLEGKVTFVKARSLVLDDKSYPVSMYVRVFNGDEKGPETTMQILANIGKIDKARIYVLRGKVEKIIVLKNI